MNKNLSNKAVELRREYYKKWRQNNPNKIKQYQKTYWERKAQETTKEELKEERST